MRYLSLLMIAVIAAGCGIIGGSDEVGPLTVAEYNAVRTEYETVEAAAAVQIRDWEGDIEVAQAAYASMATNTNELADAISGTPNSDVAVAAARSLAELQTEMSEMDEAQLRAAATDYEARVDALNAALNALVPVPEASVQPSSSE